MASTINASTTSTSGLVQTADASGILELQSNGVTGLTVGTGGNVVVNTNLFVSGAEVEPLVLATAQTATGSSVNFTGIPSWVKRITMNVVGLSFAAAGSSGVRIGSGSLVSTGYTWLQLTASNISTTSVGTDTTGFGNFTTATGAGAAIVYGQCVLTLVNPATNLWMSTGMAARPGDSLAQTWTGYVALSGVLDRVSLVASSSTFDAGTVNIMYE